MLFADAEGFQAIMEQWANTLLIWIGFGTLVGLTAKAVMPGKDPGGAVVTMLMGVAGSVVGCGVLMFLYDGHRVTPISPLGFLVGTGGAFILLFFYKLLAGKIIKEGGDVIEKIYLPAPHTSRGAKVIVKEK
ncbi:MAG: GlsB/YeaQ/YmgE family stress response membrane protein [Pirellulales bacterium]